MKEILTTIYRLYNYKIVLVYVISFIFTQFSPIQVIPDFFSLAKIETPQSYLLRLLSIVVGFSSFILTTVLVVFNLLSKKLKRNSLDFILYNPWIKIIFSSFGGTLIFIILSIFIAQIATLNTIVTLLYLATFYTFSNIILQFPLLILSIRHSNSYNDLKNIIEAISSNDIEDLLNPQTNEDEILIIEGIEKNRLVLIKDIGVSAIKEADWALPQTILNNLFNKLITKSNDNIENDNTFFNKLSAYSFVSRHFEKVAFENSDEITIKVILNNYYRFHLLVVEKRFRKIRHNPLDNSLQELLRRITATNSLYNIQQYIINNVVRLINKHIESVNYSDEQLPTSDYIYSIQDFDYNSRDEVLSDYWYYLKNELPKILFLTLERAIESGNKTVFERYNWQFHNLFDKISESKTLTESQQNELFNEYSFKARKITDLAIRHNIFNNIEIYSNTQIKRWILQGKKFAFVSLYDFSSLIKKLCNLNSLDRMMIDEYFMIARMLATQKMDKLDKEKVLITIIEDGFEMLSKAALKQEIELELKNQLNWLNQYLMREEDLETLKLTYSSKISDL